MIDQNVTLQNTIEIGELSLCGTIYDIVHPIKLSL